MTNITQQEIIEDAIKSNLWREPTDLEKKDNTFADAIAQVRLDNIKHFAQLIEARLAARSDDRQRSNGDWIIGILEKSGNTFEYVTDANDIAKLPDGRHDLYLAPQQAIPAEILTTLKLLRDNLAAGAESYKAQHMADKLIRELSAAPTAPIESDK